MSERTSLGTGRVSMRWDLLKKAARKGVQIRVDGVPALARCSTPGVIAGAVAVIEGDSQSCGKGDYTRERP